MAFRSKSILPNHTVKADFDGDGFTDIVWQGLDGTIAAWNMSQNGLFGRSGLFVPSLDRSLTFKGYGDFNGNGTTDLLYQGANGIVQVWNVSNNQVTGISTGGSNGTQEIRGIGDFNGDGRSDLLWFTPPSSAAGFADGAWFSGSADTRKIPPIGLGKMDSISIDFQLTGIGDFNGDNKDDILFRGTGNATVGTFLLESPTGRTSATGGMETTRSVFGDPGPSWNVLSLADFNGDGRSDILWEHRNDLDQVDARSVWLMKGAQYIGGGMVPNPGGDWAIVATGDYNNDLKADLMWRHTPTGTIGEWFMDGANPVGAGVAYASPGSFWTLIA